MKPKSPQAGIGLVVADDQVAARLQGREHRGRQAPVAAPQHADLPRPVLAVHARREAVDGDHRRHDAGAAEGGDAARDRAMIGQEVAEHAIELRRRRQALVARNDAAVADLGDRGRRARAAVGVDHQPRHVVKDRRRAQQPGELAGHVGGADVPADMLRQRLVAQAELRQLVRNAAAGMVAEEQNGSVASPGLKQLEMAAGGGIVTWRMAKGLGQLPGAWEARQHPSVTALHQIALRRRHISTYRRAD